jgi:hypothetical protein
MNKMEQLTLRPSGDPTLTDIGYVYLHSDGRMFGKVLRGVLAGAKVVADDYRGRLWEVVL